MLLFLGLERIFFHDIIIVSLMRIPRKNTFHVSVSGKVMMNNFIGYPSPFNFRLNLKLTSYNFGGPYNYFLRFSSILCPHIAILFLFLFFPLIWFIYVVIYFILSHYIINSFFGMKQSTDVFKKQFVEENSGLEVWSHISTSVSLGTVQLHLATISNWKIL